jgi:hypothetical protein
MVATSGGLAARSTAGPDAPGRGAIPLVVPLPRRAGRFAWRFQDAAHGLLLGLLAPVIVAPILLLGEAGRSAAAWSVLIAYAAWLSIVAKLAVGFARARERAALVAFLFVSCFLAATAGQGLVTLYSLLVANAAAGAGR